jgi:hypothetical protein
LGGDEYEIIKSAPFLIFLLRAKKNLFFRPARRSPAPPRHFTRPQVEWVWVV